jgi:hypothetical protein
VLLCERLAIPLTFSKTAARDLDRMSRQRAPSAPASRQETFVQPAQPTPSRFHRGNCGATIAVA